MRRRRADARGYSRRFTADPETAKRYLLDQIPALLWVSARAKAKREGLSMRGLLLTLLAKYVEGGDLNHAS